MTLTSGVGGAAKPPPPAVASPAAPHAITGVTKTSADLDNSVDETRRQLDELFGSMTSASRYLFLSVSICLCVSVRCASQSVCISQSVSVHLSVCLSLTLPPPPGFNHCMCVLVSLSVVVLICLQIFYPSPYMSVSAAHSACILASLSLCLSPYYTHLITCSWQCLVHPTVSLRTMTSFQSVTCSWVVFQCVCVSLLITPSDLLLYWSLSESPPWFTINFCFLCPSISCLHVCLFVWPRT